MENDVLFYEVQKKSPWWVWFIVAITNIVMLYSVYEQTKSGIKIGFDTINFVALAFTIACLVLLNLFLYVLRLETIVKKSGICVRFFPLQRKYRSYFFEAISKCYIRRYRPIPEYGGWGMRGFGNNRSFTMSGNMGMQINLKNGSKTLIGTQKPEELGKVLEKPGFNTL